MFCSPVAIQASIGKPPLPPTQMLEDGATLRYASVPLK